VIKATLVALRVLYIILAKSMAYFGVSCFDYSNKSLKIDVKIDVSEGTVV
jgi:hypothetical protein